MNRRKVLISVGAVISGATAAVGTGAFSNATVQRDVTVSVVSDDEAILRMDPNSDLPNSDYATETADGVLTVDISEAGDNVAGDGISPNAKTTLEETFPIENQGEETVQVSVTSDELANQDPERFEVFATNVPGEDDEFRTNLLEGTDDLPVIGPGKSFDVGIEIDVPDDVSEIDDLLGGLDVLISADANEVNAS